MYLHQNPNKLFLVVIFQICLRRSQHKHTTESIKCWSSTVETNSNLWMRVRMMRTVSKICWDWKRTGMNWKYFNLLCKWPFEDVNKYKSICILSHETDFVELIQFDYTNFIYWWKILLVLFVKLSLIWIRCDLPLLKWSKCIFHVTASDIDLYGIWTYGGILTVFGSIPKPFLSFQLDQNPSNAHNLWFSQPQLVHKLINSYFIQL